MTLNRRWVLARRPVGQVGLDDFARIDAEMPVPDLAKGEILVRNRILGFDPAQRGWMDKGAGYMTPMALGEPVRGSACAEVIASQNPAYPVGRFVRGLFGWQDYAVVARAGETAPILVPEGVQPEEALGVLGAASLTAWAGIKTVGGVKSGDCVLVSGAAGAVGSMVVQIARLNGARVIGIAGGTEKCRWLVEDYGAEAAIDYRNEDVAVRLADLAPDGIDLFFDNVGGDILEAAIGHMAFHGRIVLCGSISGYNDEQPSSGPCNLSRMISYRLSMQGFILLDHLDQVPTASAELRGWLEAGKLRYRTDIQHGFDAIPATFLRLFTGENQGKQLLRLDA
ncbi:NADP-dependent oxidoreductase [Brevundimonas sp.]|uniref:NADP-dependent oxidoreductase n=1 Tax=Brevundimonas sp. TaxID=1871086 RepID=UPI002FC7EA05